ncbi:MAG: hypothetical protein H0W75_10195, partial [Chitinophagaceae bacterium]|nr:hypothetical protein [Chitinophagaceae bacterium]
MKNNFIYISLFIFYIFLTAASCKKPRNNTDELPPETTTGAMTFGCKVNGQVFVPKDGRGKPGLIAQYVYLGNGPGGGWYLNIPATNWIPHPTEGFNIGTDSLLIEEGKTYEFKLSPTFQTIKGSAFAMY